MDNGIFGKLINIFRNEFNEVKTAFNFFIGEYETHTTTVTLPNNGTFCFCFKKAKIINDVECDYYEHNKKCDENHEVFNRTHRKRTSAGYRAIGDKYSRLNECDYCCKNHEVKKYILSEKATQRYKESLDADDFECEIRY